MVIAQKTSSKGEILKILTVLLGGVLSALLLVGSAAYYYDGTKKYQVKNILLHPDMLQEFSSESKVSQSGQGVQVTFDHVSYLSLSGKKTRLDIGTYEKVFDEISKKTSVSSDLLTMESIFQNSPYTRLFIFEKEKGVGLKIFQEVHFTTDGSGLFRVEMNQSNSEGKWAYFYDKHIEDKLLKWME